MAYDGWICMGGLEVANQCRSVAYSQAAGAAGAAGECGDCWPVANDCGCCPQLHTDDLYIDPVSDPAPWYDPDVPESKEFHGLLVTSVTGLGPGKVTRDTIARASGQGSILGQPVQAAPLITVTGVLLGSSCCGIDYGKRWLKSMLRGACGGDTGCTGEDLTFYTCCPDDIESPGESPPESPGDDPTDHYLRTLKGVALVSSPEVVETLENPDCPCPIEKIEFQLAASWPCQFTAPEMVAEDVEFIPWEPPAGTCRFHWVECDEPPTCDDVGACLIDPNCPPPEPPPRAPAIKNPCTCAPWRPAMGCADIDASRIPDHADGIPIITIRTGDTQLRHVSIRFYDNPLNLPVDELDPCAACGSVLLSRIPPDSTFVMDGTNRSVEVTCPGSAPTDASPLLAQAGGRLPFSWPVIECGTTTYTVCIEVDADDIVSQQNEFASFDVAISAREC